MKRMIATAILALPLAALCVVPKPASAEPGYQGYNNGRPTVSAQIINRIFDNNRPQRTIGRNDRDYNNNRQGIFEKGRGQRHRQWVAAHYEKVNHHRRWVPGHYVYQ